MPPQPLTLIVATTPTEKPLTQTLPRRLGIGLNGTLPWPRIKTDMSFFARVTSRPPHQGSTNAIIMGRKTYDSVPVKLRPLGKRLSVVISRDRTGEVQERVLGELRGRILGGLSSTSSTTSSTGAGAGTGTTGTTGTISDGNRVATEGKTDAIVASGLEEALEVLDKDVEGGRRVGKVFVIGGAEIYAAALRLKGSRKVRIVMTNVERTDGQVFECDTFFPVDEELFAEKGWRKVRPEEVTEWVGESVSSEWIEEGQVRVQMVGYERVD